MSSNLIKTIDFLLLIHVIGLLFTLVAETMGHFHYNKVRLKLQSYLEYPPLTSDSTRLEVVLR